MGFFDRLINIQGTAVNEAVLEDPETIEWMASRTHRDDGPIRPRIFGHTRQIDLLMAAIEVHTGKPMKRPLIKGLQLRVQRNVIKTKDAVAEAQERNRKKALGT